METRIGASNELQAVRAKVLTRFAGISVDDDMASARQQLEAARKALSVLPVDDPTTKLREAAILVHEAQIAQNEQAFERALSLATSAVEAASANPSSAVDARLVLADAYHAESYAQWKMKHYVDGAATADACLTWLDADTRESENSLRFIYVKCLHVKALNISDGKIGDFVDHANALYRSEIEVLKDLIDLEPSNVGYRVTLSKVLNNLASFGEAEAKTDVQLSLLQEAREAARGAENIAPWSTDAIDILAHTSHWAAATMVKLDRRQDAFAAYAEAATLRKALVAKDPANVDWRNRYEDTLYALRDNIVEIGDKGLSPQQLDYAIDVLQERIRLLEQPTEAEIKDDYAKWELLDTKFRLAEALRWDERIVEAADAYQALMDATKGAVGVDSQERRPRFYAAWAHFNYPKCEYFYLGNMTLQEKIANCQKSIDLREAYLAKEDHWGVRGGIALNRHVLGKLLFEAGRNQEALAHVEYAVSRNVEAAIQTLQGWYQNGDGPVAADPVKAAALSKRLSDESFGMKRFTVPSLSWDRETKFGLSMYIRNPTEFEPDPVGDELHRLQVIEGYDVPEDVEVSFRKLFKIAKDNDVCFMDLTVYALAEAEKDKIPAGQEALQKAIFEALIAKDYARLLQSTAPFFETDSGGETLDAVLAELAKKPEKDPIINPDGLHYLVDNWWNILNAGGYKLAERVASALMKQATTLEDRTIWLYQRGLSRSRGGDFAGAIDDLSTVAVSYPEYSQGLNSLAYAYLQSGAEPDRALEIAKRAIQIAPENNFIKDTLGYAQIKTNSLDAGIKTLNEVVAADANLADAWAHLAEGYRLAGRFGEAREAIRRARENAKLPRLTAYIDEQEKLNAANEKAAAGAK